MSLYRLFQGHGFRNTGRYSVTVGYDVYEIVLKDEDGTVLKTIECNGYEEKPTGVAIKQAEEPAIEYTLSIHPQYNETRVVSYMDEYTVNRLDTTEYVSTTVEQPDLGIVFPSRPKAYELPDAEVDFVGVVDE
jgi:hypothetical protein